MGKRLFRVVVLGVVIGGSALGANPGCNVTRVLTEFGGLLPTATFFGAFCTSPTVEVGQDDGSLRPLPILSSGSQFITVDLTGPTGPTGATGAQGPTGPPGGNTDAFPSDCCIVHPSAGCLDTICEALVCDVDPACCTSGWPEECAEIAKSLPLCREDCAPVCYFDVCYDLPSDCCSPHPTPGCDDPTCQEIVCEEDPYCCEIAWDEFCAVTAGTILSCFLECPSP